MKVRINALILTAAVIICLFVASCEDTTPPPRPDRYELPDTNYTWQNEVAPFLSRDFRVTNTNEDSFNNIEYMNFPELKGNILSSMLIRSDGNSGSGNVFSFIDLSKGEKRNICPDPLCSHKMDICKYEGFYDLVSFGNEEIYYAVKDEFAGNEFYGVLYEIVPANDSVKEVVRIKMPPPEAGGGFMTVINATERFVFLRVYEYYKKTKASDDESGSRGEEYREYELKYYRYIRASGKVEHLYDISGEEDEKRLAPEIEAAGEVEFTGLYYTDEKQYFCDYSEYGKVVNYRSVDIPEGYFLGNWMSSNYICRDRLTGDIWIRFAADTLNNLNDLKNYKGYICVLKENGELERVSMPADNIFDFALTDKYIYYTVFDPYIYGKGRVGACMNPTNSKIYRIDRSTLSDPELIFDGKHEFCFPDGWIVYGDCIYGEYYKYMEGGEYNFHRRMGSVAAINFAENTMKWFNLD
ncbi:MAG: hypothetical protein GX628_11110 [Clostridiales bacterium]|nr:hypothetical protein [Clostridiales bacterium]